MLDGLLDSLERDVLLAEGGHLLAEVNPFGILFGRIDPTIEVHVHGDLDILVHLLDVHLVTAKDRFDDLRRGERLDGKSFWKMEKEFSWLLHGCGISSPMYPVSKRSFASRHRFSLPFWQ